jgi:2-phosphoglycerate kinase
LGSNDRPGIKAIRSDQPDWEVLLIGGPSGVGKTVAATQLARQLGIPCLEVDDIRLALQYSRVRLSTEAETSALYFLETEGIWRLSPTRLRDALIAVGEVLSPALEIIVANHVATRAPVIIEGDGIVPSLLARPSIRDYAEKDVVRAVFVVEADEAAIRKGILMRARGTAGKTEEELDVQASTSWLYGQWLAREAERYGLEVLEGSPWASLAERILARTQ